MKHIMRWRLFLSVLMLLLGVSLTGEAAKKSVAVMPLENISGFTEQRVAEIMTEQVIAALNRSGAYIVAERTQLGTAMQEIGFQSTGAVDATQAVQLGQMIGAQYSLVGKVTMAEVVENSTGTIVDIFVRGSSQWTGRYRGKVSMNIRFIDNKTGENILTLQTDGAKAGNDRAVALHEACKEAANKALTELLKKNPMIASVLDVEGDVMYIDQGADAGLRVGDVLEIVREGKAVTNREGKVIAVKQITLGKAKVEKVEAEYSICRILNHAESMQRGDLAKRG